MIEQEIKRILTYDQYDRCFAYLMHIASFKKRYIQINNYYDTPDFKLYKAGETLRVRKKEDQLMLEYKYNRKLIEGAYFCNEYTAPITNIPAELSLTNYFSAFSDMTQYRLIGSLMTERMDFSLDQMKISLDKNDYLNTRDYEIEIEFNDNVPSSLIAVLPIGDTISLDKYSRFVTKYKEKESEQ